MIRRRAAVVSRDGEDAVAVRRHPARRPDPFLLTVRGPSRHVPRLDVHGDHPAAVVAAVSVITAVGDIENAAHERQRAALVLIRRIELVIVRRFQRGNVDGPSSDFVSRVDRERVDLMVTAGVGSHEDGARPQVDHRRADDSVAAHPDAVRPDDVADGLLERIDDVR